jgi:hypothetical protein
VLPVLDEANGLQRHFHFDARKWLGPCIVESAHV